MGRSQDPRAPGAAAGWGFPYPRQEHDPCGSPPSWSGQRVEPAAAPGEQPKPTELGSKEDFQLLQAIAHLKGEPLKGVQKPTVANTKPAGATEKSN